MSFHLSTKERLLLLVDDIEIIAKELIENTIAPKHQKISSVEHAALVDLLVSKDEEFRKMLQLAGEQEKIEKTMDNLKNKVNVYDREIQKLQNKLKEAEQILSTAIFQARRKLNSITKANKQPVSSEELIKYAHRISASNAVCAPLTWMQGDLRRPYPTDIEMRLGFLGKNELNLNGKMPGMQNSVTDVQNRNSDVPTSNQNQFAWQMGELHMSMSSGNSVQLDTRAHKDATQDDVEVMSTDSSSSSSSDSQ
ncbi:mediator of RNA polymerase II transcription subunit 4 [Condylostylus longicornis]|uniref:mediator of RNA polymerase II transcription subunit 4 n=1 Tax=Condylostylus longicornis TaxID=2530218 RepID=UPI00244E5104|nr:mediator of RNA polymerase II transcription subunit 4 [Condylostylus longicornis]